MTDDVMKYLRMGSTGVAAPDYGPASGDGCALDSRRGRAVREIRRSMIG